MYVVVNSYQIEKDWKGVVVYEGIFQNKMWNNIKNIYEDGKVFF